MRGLLDLLKETWEAPSQGSDESIVSYVLSVQERLAKMTELVHRLKSSRSSGMTKMQESESLKMETRCWYYYRPVLAN